MMSAWRPLFRTDTFGNVGIFNMLGVEPVVWWVFTLMMGTAAGAVLRRTLPAIAGCARASPGGARGAGLLGRLAVRRVPW